MSGPFRRLIWLTTVTGLSLVGIYVATVVRYRGQLREEIRQAIINRDAAVLRPVALRQLADRENTTDETSSLLSAVLESAKQEGMLGVAIFDAQGRTLRYAPDSLLFPELPIDDYLRLLKGESISRYHPDFPLGRYFGRVEGGAALPNAPVLEVLFPLHGQNPDRVLGFAQYFIDARALSAELGAIDARVNQQTVATLALGVVLIFLVVAAGYAGLRRAQRAIEERNERLIRANFDLSLAAKTSAIGQLTANLIHGLQGSVAGLRAVVSGREGGTAAPSDWETAADYTAQMQAMIQETVALLGDSAASAAYELTGYELAEIVQGRGAPLAAKKGVEFTVSGGFSASLDSHRGGLLCLIVHNLVQNAIEATDRGKEVAVIFRNGGPRITVLVSDEGPGIPPEIRARLFQPGRTARPGGTGLGLAISQLLAKQIGASLTLESTGNEGTTFNLSLPLDGDSSE